MRGLCFLAAGLLIAWSCSAHAMKAPPSQTGEAARLKRPGYLGVSLRDLDTAEATRLRIPLSSRGNHEPTGAMIVTVDRDAPAWTSGLRPGDVVVELNAQPVDGVEDLRRRLRECPAGDIVTLRIRRREEERSFAVPLGDQDAIAQNALNQHLHPAGSGNFPGGFGWAASGPPLFTPPAPAPNRGVASTLFDALIPGSTYTGLEVDPLSPQLASFFGIQTRGGLLVTSVSADSPAALAGLTAGDVILRAANRPVNSRSALARALRGGKGNPVPLAIMRNHQEVVLSLLPGKRKKL